MAVALLAGLLFAALCVLGREQLFNVIRTPDDVGRKLGLPSLGAIPKMQEGFAIEQEVLDPKSLMSETFSSLRSSLMLVSSHGLPRSLMFTSAKQGEGKSSCAFRSEEHTFELQSLMRISYAVFCLKHKNQKSN